MFDSDELVVSDPATMANTDVEMILGSFIAGSATCSSCRYRCEPIRTHEWTRREGTCKVIDKIFPLDRVYESISLLRLLNSKLPKSFGVIPNIGNLY